MPRAETRAVGTNQHVDVTASGLGANTNRFIQGAELTVIDTRGALLYTVVRAQGDQTKQIITIGPGSTRARADYTGFIQVTTNALGEIPIGIDAACFPGNPLPALVTIYFFS